MLRAQGGGEKEGGMRTTAQILRDYRGPALFSFGFRPFFLLAALWSALAVPLWVLSYLGIADPAGALLTRDWHVHEMLFGYAGGIIVGYMIVAGANWTGHYPVAGRPVMALVALWLAGRAAMVVQPLLGPVCDVIDAVFLSLFAAIMWREQLAASNWRSLPPCLVVSALALADIAFHLGLPGAERAGLALVIFLIAMMGGRLVPSFTRNWFARNRILPEPAPQGPRDRVAMALTGAGLGLWVLWPEARAVGPVLVAGGLGLLVRLAGWRGWVAWREPMVVILHLAYLWCALGLLALGGAVLWPGGLSPSVALHALTAGGIGTMTLAMMTRTSRSHTGHERIADPATRLIYALVTLAALGRVAAPLLPGLYAGLLVASTLCWSAAFAGFALAYGPMLSKPMQKPRRAAKPQPDAEARPKGP